CLMANLTNAMMLKTSSLILPNLQGYYDASQMPLGATASFTDLSGNGNHYTQGTGANKPVCTANHKNGRNTMPFTGSSPTFFNAPSGLFPLFNGANTQYLICERDSSTSLQIVMNFGGTNATENAIFYGASANLIEGTCEASNTHIAQITTNF